LLIPLVPPEIRDPGCGRPFVLDPTKLSGDGFQFWWLDPRNGGNIDLGILPRVRRFEIIPPSVGENLDWVLVCDDASKGYLPPGIDESDDRTDRGGIKPLPD
jgi:collagenase-like protein with putative collagen-binding domain